MMETKMPYYCMPPQHQGSERQDQFAEYLARGYSIPAIRAKMCLTKGAAQGLMKRIRDNLGAQAV